MKSPSPDNLSALVRDAACTKDFLWRTDLNPTKVEKLSEALRARGFRSTSPSSLLVMLESFEGHTIIIVPRTGRIQLRLDFLTPHALREKTANTLYAQLRNALLEPGNTPR